MTLEEIFQTNPELRNAPEVQKLIAYTEAQQQNNHRVNLSHLNFRTKIADLVFDSEALILSGKPNSEVIQSILNLL